MRCPFCSYEDTKVVDSRPTEDGSVIRRRRLCPSCNKRFTTYEKYDLIPIVVIKKDGTREPFNRKKVLEGMIRACEKRPVPLQRLEVATEAVEAHLQQSHKKEVESVEIGELVMDELRLIDQVAFVRFASVYREFEDVHKFYDALEKLRDS